MSLVEEHLIVEVARGSAGAVEGAAAGEVDMFGLAGRGGTICADERQ